jgi:hypothetical protein
MNMSEEKKIQWQPLVELGIVLITILGSTIPLYLHMDSKIDKFQEKNQEILEAIRLDIRDFHGRLCTIEEKNKSK